MQDETLHVLENVKTKTAIRSKSPWKCLSCCSHAAWCYSCLIHCILLTSTPSPTETFYL
uniref:Uncharacterized protein n=1 Tax=Arundo donax TaxID=35708 RepID=A0A0A9AUJ7_ARUDO